MAMSQPAPWLTPIPGVLHGKAVAALEAKDAVGFLCLADNRAGIALVYNNFGLLERLGIYEEALLNAFIGTRTNNHHYPLSELRFLFECADRSRLRALGVQVPPDWLFKLYRGVAGRGRARRIRGLSWTLTYECALWFAERFQLPDPCVVTAVVPAHDVLVYVPNARQEDEAIVLLSPDTRVKRIHP